MNLAKLIVSEARKRGIEHIFGIPGSGFPMDLMEAGRKVGIDFVVTANESSAAIAAAYYGVMKDSPGIALSVKGVGAGNLVGGAVNAYFERQGVLCLCEAGDPNLNVELVQVTDHDRLFGAVAVYQATLNHESAAEMLRDAIAAAQGPRPGPSVLNINRTMAEGDVGEPLASLSTFIPQSSTGNELERLSQVIQDAGKIVVIAGQDVVRHEATEELYEFIERFKAAVLVSMEARGLFPESNPRWAGVFIGAYAPNHIETEIVKDADLVLLIGVDALMAHEPWSFDVPTCELVVSSNLAAMSPTPKVKVIGNLRASLEYLRVHSEGTYKGFSIDEIASIKQNILRLFDRPTGAIFTQQDIIEIARRQLPDDGVLISETGAFVRFLEHLWPVDRPGTFFGTSGGRTMGLMIPAALGAKMARPDLTMIGMGADGSLLMRLGDLETFARTGTTMPLIILNDHALGTIKSRQKSRGMPDYGLDLQPVDFSQVASAMGLNGVVVKTSEHFDKVLQEAIEADKATVIDCRIDPQPYWDSFGPSIGVIDQA